MNTSTFETIAELAIGLGFSGTIDEYWAAELGISVELLKQPGVVLVHEGRGGFEGYAGVLFFRRGHTLVVSAQPEVVQEIASSMASLSPAAIEDVPFLRTLVGTEATQVVGPVFQGFVMAERFSPPPASPAAITPDLLTVESQLRPECEHQEWEASGLSGVSGPVAAAVENDVIVAAAGLRDRQRGVVHPCVLTRPAHRGRGLGQDVVAHVAQTALDRGDLVAYQTLWSNHGAVAIARKLGFEEYATAVAVRLS